MLLAGRRAEEPLGPAGHPASAQNRLGRLLRSLCLQRHRLDVLTQVREPGSGIEEHVRGASGSGAARGPAHLVSSRMQMQQPGVHRQRSRSIGARAAAGLCGRLEGPALAQKHPGCCWSSAAGSRTLQAAGRSLRPAARLPTARRRCPPPTAVVLQACHHVFSAGVGAGQEQQCVPAQGAPCCC